MLNNTKVIFIIFFQKKSQEEIPRKKERKKEKNPKKKQKKKMQGKIFILQCCVYVWIELKNTHIDNPRPTTAGGERERDASDKKQTNQEDNNKEVGSRTKK